MSEELVSVAALFGSLEALGDLLADAAMNTPEGEPGWSFLEDLWDRFDFFGETGEYTAAEAARLKELAAC